MTKERDVVLDILRALAILMVVTVHTWSLARIDANAYPVLSVVYACFHRCGVPLFVMISGALQLSAPVRPLGEFYKKRYLRILIYLERNSVYSVVSGRQISGYSFAERRSAMLYPVYAHQSHQ